MSGSVELAPNLGLAETIVNLVEAGRTLRENGLEICERLAESSARRVVRRAGFRVRHQEVKELMFALREAPG